MIINGAVADTADVTSYR